MPHEYLAPLRRTAYYAFLNLETYFCDNLPYIDGLR